MAKHIIDEVLCDITGESGARTFRFSYNGIHYEIDLAGDHANEFEGFMDKWITHARLAPAVPVRRFDAADVRRWWRVNAEFVRKTIGVDFTKMGPVPARIYGLYEDYLKVRGGRGQTL